MLSRTLWPYSSNTYSYTDAYKAPATANVFEKQAFNSIIWASLKSYTCDNLHVNEEKNISDWGMNCTKLVGATSTKEMM